MRSFEDLFHISRYVLYNLKLSLLKISLISQMFSSLRSQFLTQADNRCFYLIEENIASIYFCGFVIIINKDLAIRWISEYNQSLPGYFIEMKKERLIDLFL